MDYFEILREQYIERYSKVRQDDEYYYLYKHFAFDEKLAVLGVFNNNQLLYSNPNAFNDPYDCLCILDYDFSKVKRAHLEGMLGERITNKNFSERKDQYIRRLKELPEIKEWGDQSRSEFYVTCFNNNPLNILMWSHYAQNHEGFMLEFKFKKIQNFYANLPMPVFYNEEFPILRYPFNLTTEDCLKNPNYGSELIIKRLLNKALVWEYEQEFRLPNKKDVLEKSNRALIEFKPELISSVVLGARTKSIHREKIKAAVDSFKKVNNVKVEIFQAHLAQKSYSLEVGNHPRL